MPFQKKCNVTFKCTYNYKVLSWGAQSVSVCQPQTDLTWVAYPRSNSKRQSNRARRGCWWLHTTHRRLKMATRQFLAGCFSPCDKNMWFKLKFWQFSLLQNALVLTFVRWSCVWAEIVPGFRLVAMLDLLKWRSLGPLPQSALPPAFSIESWTSAATPIENTFPQLNSCFWSPLWLRRTIPDLRKTCWPDATFQIKKHHFVWFVWFYGY